MTDVLLVVVAAAATAAATGLGALPFLATRRPPETWLGTANALAAGFMVGASIGLVIEGVEASAGRTAAGVGVGLVAMVVADALVHRREHPHFGALRGVDAARALLIVGVMTVHSFAEGAGVGVSFGDTATFGILIAVAIAVHNIPEGLAISLVLVPRGVGILSAARWSIFSSLPQPLVAVPAFLFVEAFESMLPAGLGFAAGAMAWLALIRLVPDALAQTSRVRVAVIGALATAVMLGFQLALVE